MKNAGTLFSIPATVSAAGGLRPPPGSSWQVPESGVGTNATRGASPPARLRATSSSSLSGFSTIMPKPSATSAPTNTLRAGVQ